MPRRAMVGLDSDGEPGRDQVSRSLFRIKSPRGRHGLHGSFVVGFEDKEGIPNSFGPSVRGTCIDSLLGIVIYVSGFGHAD